MPPKAGRWVREMQEIGRTFREDGGWEGGGVFDEIGRGVQVRHRGDGAGGGEDGGTEQGEDGGRRGGGGCGVEGEEVRRRVPYLEASSSPWTTVYRRRGWRRRL